MTQFEEWQEIRLNGCVVCKSHADIAHIKSRGSGGGNEPDNIIALCRTHHREQHDKGWAVVANKYPILMEHLQKKGWRLVTWFGLTKLERVNND